MSENNEIKNLQREISELKRQNNDLISKLESLNDIYINTTIGLYRTSVEGNIIDVNPPLIKMLGFDSLTDLQKHNLNDNALIKNKNRQDFIKTISKQKVIIGKEAIWIKKNGEVIYVRESAKAVEDENGKIKYIDGTVEDISAQKIKENELFEIEIKFKKLIDILPNGVVIHKENNIIFANEYAQDLLQVSKNGLIKQNIFDYIHEDYHKKVKLRLQESLKEFKQVNITEHVFVTGQGNKINTEVITTPYRQDNEIYLLTVFSDISERKRTEKELKLSEITYRGMLNSISEAIFIQDEEGDFIDINKAAENFFGYTFEFFVGKNPRHLEASGKNDLDEIFNKITLAYNGKPQILEYWGKNSNGTEFLSEVSLVSGIYFDKKVVIAVLRDITKRKETENLLIESEQKYKSLINFAVGGILIGNLDGVITEVNTYMYKLLGRKRNEIVGKHISDGFFTKSSIGKKPLDFNKVKNGEIVINQREILRPDGTIVPVEMHSKLLPNNTYQSIYHDITDRLKIENEILLSKANTEALNDYKDALLSALPDLLFTFNKQGNIIDFYSNSDLQLISEPKYFLNKNIKEIMPIDIANITLHHIKQVLSKKIMANFQYNLEINKKIEYFDAKMVCFQENKVLAVIRNITERMTLIDELKNARAKAVESDKLKSAFLSNLSHEIRTPMNGILGFAELLKDDITKAEKLEYLEIIENSCNQLLLILDDIIEFSKIEAGLIRKNTDTLEINSFIKDIYTQMMVLFQQKTEVKFILSDSIPKKSINSITDTIKLKQILSNLISNACKFTEKGFVELGYYLISDTHIMFYVKDTGIGISLENQEKIFNRFFQIDSQSTSSNGSGLGLSICKAYANILNGELSVKSELNKGTCFYFEMPIISYS